jgi:hypothetical protein
MKLSAIGCVEVPASLDDVGPAWLTEALRSSGVLQQGEVTACSVTPIGSDFGFASQVGRVVPSYRDGGPGAPPSMVVKLAIATADPGLRRVLIEKSRNEAGFYRDLAHRVGVRVPRCYFVADDPSTGGIALLLEDLADARFGDDGAGCSLREAVLVIESLAAMHARWWNDEGLERIGWLRRWGRLENRLRRFEEARPRFLDRYDDLVTGEMAELTERIGQEHVAPLERLAGPPVTLLHVDTHLDNIAWVKGERDTEALLFDWQGVSTGRSVVDLSLFMLSALRGDQRRHEAALLERYCRGLVKDGVAGYPLSRLRADYRLAMLRWWVGTVSGLGSTHAGSWAGRQAALGRDSVRRWSIVIRDLRLIELL